MYPRIKSITVVTVFSIAGGLFGDLPAQEHASLEKQFLAEAPAAWEKYRQRAEGFQGSLDRTRVRLSPKRELIGKDRCEIRQKQGCDLFKVQGLEGGDPTDRVGYASAINKQYGFELSRQVASSPWFATQIDVDLSDGLKPFNSHPSKAVARWTTCPVTFALVFNFSQEKYRDTTVNPGFTFKRFTPVTLNDQQMVKVELAYRPPTKNSSIPAFHGWVLYNPQNYWVIEKYQFQLEWNTSPPTQVSEVVSYEYEKASDGNGIKLSVSHFEY